MIYTVTFNPTLDYGLFLDEIRPGEVNRAKSTSLNIGGKGINVSIVLSRLGVDNVALGFIAGFTGHAFLEMLTMENVLQKLLVLQKGMTRINVKLETGTETDINAGGPDVPPEAVARLMNQLEALNPGDTLVLAGSIPASMPPDIYETIMQRFSGKGIRFVVDATGDLLRNVLPLHPFLVKPNIHELGDLFGVELAGFDQVAEYARRLQALGAQNVLVSMGGDGALLLDENGAVTAAPAPGGRVKSAVGAGDSMVAGFLAGYARTGSYQKAYRLGVACGSATAFNDWLATKQDIATLLEEPLESYGI